MKLLIPGNSKMGEKVLMFNLPAKDTCTPTRWCLEARNGKPACCALRGRSIWPNAIKGAQDRYKSSLQADFVDRIVKVIKKKSQRFFRVHASGDFYSKEYVEKWIKIAKQFSDKLFRTTTRRRDLTSILQKLNSLPNFIVRESLDIERPEPVMGLPFAALSSLDIVKKEEAYKCIDDCTSCEYYCWENRDNIFFDEL